MNITIDTNGLRVYVGSSYLTITRTGGFHLRVMRFHLTVDAWLAPVTRDAAVPFVDPEPFMQAHYVGEPERNPFLSYDDEIEVVTPAALTLEQQVAALTSAYDDAIEAQNDAWDTYLREDVGCESDEYRAYIRSRNYVADVYGDLQSAQRKFDEQQRERSDEMLAYLYGTDTDDPFADDRDDCSCCGHDEPITEESDDFEFALANADRVKHGRDLAFYGYR